MRRGLRELDFASVERNGEIAKGISLALLLLLLSPMNSESSLYLSECRQL